MLSIGNPLPSCTVIDETGQTLPLEFLRGQWTVLYFYPADDTPSCTAEACAFRDEYTAFKNLNVQVVGISPDPVRSHQAFKEKYQLPFRLVSDPNHHVAEAFGVWQQKKLFGQTFFGVRRTTFIIDPLGIIQGIVTTRLARNHTPETLVLLERLIAGL